MKARFIGKPSGVYMKGAPCNYTHGAVYTIPLKFAQFKYWEILDPPPVLKVPAASVEDSVFENQVFVPPELNDPDEMSKEGKEALKEAMKEAKTEPAILYKPIKEEEKFDSIPVNLTMEVKDEKPERNYPDEIGAPLDEPPVEPVPTGGVEALLESVKAKREKSPFDLGVSPEEEMPPELRYELESMGDGIIGEGGEVKIERRKKVQK